MFTNKMNKGNWRKKIAFSKLACIADEFIIYKTTKNGTETKSAFCVAFTSCILLSHWVVYLWSKSATRYKELSFEAIKCLNLKIMQIIHTHTHKLLQNWRINMYLLQILNTFTVSKKMNRQNGDTPQLATHGLVLYALRMLVLCNLQYLMNGMRHTKT